VGFYRRIREREEEVQHRKYVAHAAIKHLIPKANRVDGYDGNREDCPNCVRTYEWQDIRRDRWSNYALCDACVKKWTASRRRWDGKQRKRRLIQWRRDREWLQSARETMMQIKWMLKHPEALESRARELKPEKILRT